MNKKSIICIICCIVVVVGIVTACAIKLNFGLEYSEHTEIDIYIGKQFDSNEIKSIAKEELQSKNISINKVEVYEDMVCIKTKGEVNSEQIENLNTKINEKYGTENKTEDIVITKVPKVKFIDLIKNYIWPTIISLVIIIIYIVGSFLILKKNKNSSSDKNN